MGAGQFEEFERQLKILVNRLVDERMKESVPKCTILSVRAAAERYDLDPSTIYKWFGRGLIRKHEVGGRSYVYIEDFERQKSREEISRKIMISESSF
jgi:hypothetical protein